MLKTKRGGGPKTPEGKQAASVNALKSGVYSRNVVLPGESEEDFQEMLAQFNRDFMPRDIAEAAIVRELAVLTWKRLRLDRIEHKMLLREMNAPVGLFDLSIYGVHLDESYTWLISDIEKVTPKFVSDQTAIYYYLNKLKSNKLSEQQLIDLPTTCPGMIPVMLDLAEEFLLFDRDTYNHTQFAKQIIIDQGQEKLFLDYAIPNIKQKALQVVMVSGQLDEISTAVSLVKEKRVLSKMQSAGPMRVSDDLSRAFFRSLAELRRQQKWRRELGIVDVEMVEDALPQN
jgi:hypothetical protein